MGGDKKQKSSGIKLKNGILMWKKANKSTPSHSWKLGFHNLDPNFSMKTSVSARKIGANLWEVEPQFNFHKDEAHHHHHHHHHSSEEEDWDDRHPPPPEMETSWRSNIRELASLRHLSVRRNSHDLQHVSSASFCSSMQMTPYACAVTPTAYALKTSTHLLKVLNRIWNLEEQHSSNVASIKMLKRELDISRAQIKTLVEEREKVHQELNQLKMSTHEGKKKVVQPTRDELLDLRSSFTREKKARVLLESLCDEFAKGIRDYEQKVRFLQQNRGKKERLVSEKEPDRLILHVSEAWLDERMQIKCDFSEKTSISDDLSCEIETFLEAKKKQSRGYQVEDNDIIKNHEEYRSRGDVTKPSSELVSMADRDRRTAEPSAPLMSGAIEPSLSRTEWGAGEAGSSQLNATGTDQGLGVGERSRRQGAKSNTLMAKLLEARLESQFSKSKTVKKVVQSGPVLKE